MLSLSQITDYEQYKYGDKMNLLTRSTSSLVLLYSLNVQARFSQRNTVMSAQCCHGNMFCPFVQLTMVCVAWSRLSILWRALAVSALTVAI